MPVEPVAPPEDRKTPIALALGGGAARGWTHIGVLRALDEAGIEISMIAGTSIGALVGGCYLAGKLDELEEFARSLTRRRMFNLLDITLRGNGLFGGMKLDGRLREHLDGVNFGDLRKPFTAVCTELRTGHEIWIEHGSLVSAMRASYALPGIFEPVRLGNRLLVDGALVNPVPVSVCRANEQPLVLAVNLHYDQFGRAAVVKHVNLQQEQMLSAEVSGRRVTSDETRMGITGVMMEAFNIIQDRISRARAAGDPADISLLPSVGHIGLTEFHRADEAISVGYRETMKHLNDIKRLQRVLL
ncbi:patatin family protein [Phyllobacterium leguminum]|uniref:patatin family protein n=1 Tax=Phyllobacterium leguminum TaxID=314237 RepID=UPI001FE00ED3|nr:patatin family protein [Phyllobacterium leguminum]